MEFNLQRNLVDKIPAFLGRNFNGYEHFTDPTVLDFSKLTYPSINCSIPSFDKVVPDKGKLLLGQAFTENTGIVGNMEKYKNLSGIEMEIRVNKSGDNTKKDIIQIFFQNDRLLFGSLTGSFQLGETVKGTTSGATGIITNILNTVLTLSTLSGTFVAGEPLVGQSSGATATVITPPTNLWRQITENTNPLPRGAHEYYFDRFFDSKQPNSIPNSVLGRNLPLAVWVNGYVNPSTKKGAAYSWTGGIALITAVVTNTSVSIDASTSWRSLGFSEDANGDAYIVVDGVSYQLTDPTDLDTSTIALTSTTGISVGDFATARIESDETPVPFDICLANKGYMYYGNWNKQQLYQSNAFNREYNYVLLNFQAIQNDLIINFGSAYTGTIESVFRIVISSITPAINEQNFTGTGINDGFFDTTTYNGTGKNVYKASVVATGGLVFSGTPSPLPTPGEYLIGDTSGAVALVAFLDAGGGGDCAIQQISGSFEVGETVSGSVSGTSFGTIFSIVYVNWWQFFKNGTPITPVTYTPFFAYQISTAPGTVVLVDNISFIVQNNTGHNVGDYWELTIRSQLADKFRWQKDDGTLSSETSITGNNQTLSDGVRIKFGNTTGHSVGDSWEIKAFPAVERAWVNFYYALPIRKPGEGYIYQLPANFWAMGVQEQEVYVNSSNGEWGVVSTTLSADLLSETVKIDPLKQAGANKVLYPYLIGHLKDKLIYISTSKNLNTIGRELFLEKPQTGYLSEPVKNDFLASSFIGGRIKFLDEKIHITSPDEGIMHVYDDFNRYWQPPKMFPEMGLLSIFGNDLITHSNSRNQSFTMFAANSDNDQSYTVRVRSAYTDVGTRWQSKTSSMSFTEGYVEGQPPIIHRVILGVNGCGAVYPHPMQPIICAISDDAPIGEGALASHPLGSDPSLPGTYFQEIWPHYQGTLTYQFIALELECTTKNHSYSYLSYGMNAALSTDGNNKLVPEVEEG